MKKLVISKNGEKVIFDDFTDEREEDYCGVWACVCKSCAEKYKSVLFDHMDDCGSGCCSVDGCENDGDFYVDFFVGDKTIKINVEEV